MLSPPSRRLVSRSSELTDQANALRSDSERLLEESKDLIRKLHQLSESIPKADSYLRIKQNCATFQSVQ